MRRKRLDFGNFEQQQYFNTMKNETNPDICREGFLPARLEGRQTVMGRKRLNFGNFEQQKYFDTVKDETCPDICREELMLIQRNQDGIIHNWTDADIGVLIVDTFRLKFTFIAVPQTTIGTVITDD